LHTQRKEGPKEDNMITGEERTVWTTELDTDRCWELLDTHVVGRVGFTSGDEQMILPVSYVVDKGHILIRTGRTDIFDKLEVGAPIAFEIDDTDRLFEAGWTVLVKGRASEITDANEGFAAERLPIDLRTSGPHNHWIRITPRSVIGRAISRGTSPEGHLLPYMPPD
jgi:nitroimidazol reductase NimA-like FMN-containing flavoprotein (pyridoxamine 5'-phosphate oxidase superfamily)